MSKKKVEGQVYNKILKTSQKDLVGGEHLEFPWAEQENTGGWRSRKALFYKKLLSPVWPGGNLCYTSSKAAYNRISIFGKHITPWAYIELTVDQNP